jgi:phosphatidyl-myo-inositol alpha-mannosyltransferase
MRVGLVSPYSFDTPGGVQAHVRDLAETLLELGHEVSVLTPAEREEDLPPYAVSAGRAVPVPYNGSVSRLAFGPLSTVRVRRWLKDGEFDVLHVHEPVAPSISLLAVMAAKGPVVATFHTSNPRSRTLMAAAGVLQPFMEKIGGRIAVSAAARRVQVEHLDGGAIEIPNGVDTRRFARAEPLPGWPGEGGAIGFLGRFEESRKGFAVLAEAFPSLAATHPDLRLLVAGPGDVTEARGKFPPELLDRITFLGKVSEVDKARMLRSVDAYIAPNTGQESFGIILSEAMAAGTAIVASDIDAFRRVLDDGTAGELFTPGDATALATATARLLDDPARRAALAAHAARVVMIYDWHVVARQVLDVYEMVVAGTPVALDDTP